MGKTVRYYFFGSVLTIAVFFAVVELATRIVSWAGGSGFSLTLHELDATDADVADLYQWHPFVGFTLRPEIGIEGSHSEQAHRSHVFVDKHAFLAADNSLSYVKEPDEIRIAASGGSTTANLNLDYEHNWPGALGIKVQQALPNKKIRVINAGTPGFHTAQSVANLALRVLPFKPDVIVVYHAYNDLKAVSSEAVFRPDYSHMHHTPHGVRERPNFATSLLNHSMFYVRTRNRYREFAKANSLADLLLEAGRMDRVPQYAEEAFALHLKTLAVLGRDSGAKVILCTFPTLHDPSLDFSDPAVFQGLSQLEQNELIAVLQFTPSLTLNGVYRGIRTYNDIIKRVAEEKGVASADIAQAVPHDTAYFLDRVHVTDKGAALVAETLAPVALRELQSAAGTSGVALTD